MNIAMIYWIAIILLLNRILTHAITLPSEREFLNIVTAAASAANCTTDSGFNNSKIGYMDEGAELYCSACYRQVLCCAPQDPMNIVQLYLYKNGMFEPIKWDDDSCDHLVNCSQITYSTHGYGGSFNNSNYLPDMVKLMSVYSCSIAVDWGKGAVRNYFQAIANVRSVGAAIAYHASRCVLKNSMVKVKVVGLSLGGQIVGEAGRYFEAMTGRKIDYCHGLDPAGPMYDGCSIDIRLSQGSCQQVQVVHTDAMKATKIPIISGLGTNLKSGHIDYWVNCGHDQGGSCAGGWVDIATYLFQRKGDDEAQKSDQQCDHVRSVYYYISHLKHNCFGGVKCADCRKKCNGSDYHGHPVTKAFMSDDYGDNDIGDYYVAASNDGDFCPESPNSYESMYIDV